ncbi:MAG TPA: CDP-2,3-bis-(O-geranylgeranyl)-sn-glycerol synthase [Candidatus Nanoarchaeia archaeon]|nr:CDP-2,3-bis-(O-geranylgeranyl)-sn-glycerol synthase [Candidatus Nanoarchaeia archaeon]
MAFLADYLLAPFYLLLPAYFANMAPVIFNSTLKFLDIPIDFGVKLGKNELFGRNKTIRGFVAGILIGIIIAFVQYVFYKNGFFQSITLLDYSNYLIIGFLLGFGALFGDLAKSFFKRRLGIPPGKIFVPFDQLDFVAGAFVFLSFIFVPSLKIILSAFVLSFFLHISLNRIGYLLKIKKNKW